MNTQVINYHGDQTQLGEGLDQLDKESYHYLLKRGPGVSALAGNLYEYYEGISKVYLEKGMDFEANLFRDVASKFEQIRAQLR